MTQPTPVFSRLENVFQVLDSILDRRASRYLTEKENADVRKFVAETLLTKRFYLVRTANQMQELWDELRSSSAVVDFVLNATNELNFWLQFSEISFETLIGRLAASYGQYRPTMPRSGADGSRAIDEDLLQRLPSTDELAQLYVANPWFITIVLMELRGLAVMTHIPNPLPPRQDEGQKQ